MRTTRQLSITLPNGMADALRERVASGAYASESEVVRDGLRALFAQEKAVESWLRTEVADAYDELRADPARAISSDEMRQRIVAHHARHTDDKPS
jgi:antitoxin ParD1/3/4